MLYFLYGEDKTRSRDKLNALISSLLKRKPNASFFKMDEESFSASALEEYIGGQGLFENKYIVVLENLLAFAKTRDEVLSKIKEIKSSENIFIVFEESVDAKTKRRIEHYSQKAQSFDAPKKTDNKKKFEIFSISDAFGRRDSKNLWVLLVKAIREGISPEEIHGILFWQAKSILTVLRVPSPNKAPLNPFVIRKSLGFSKNYTEDELRNILSELVRIYHDSRRGISDFETNLEKFTLAL